MNVHPVSWKSLFNIFSVVALVALVCSPALAGHRLEIGDGMYLVADIKNNDAGNTVWQVGISGINNNAVAVELGFEAAQFVDLVGPLGGTVDDSILANDLFLLGVFDAPNDSHYRRAPANQKGGFDTENPGNNPFTGEISTGWYQNSEGDNPPNQIFVSLGSSRNQDPSIPLIQLVTPNDGSDPFDMIHVLGSVAQNRGDSGDSFMVDGYLQVPEPTTIALAGLLGCLLGALRRRS